MKLVRYGPPGREAPGLIDRTGALRSLAAHIPSIGPAEVALETLDRLRGVDPETLPAVEDAPRLAAPLADAPNFFCIGLNYGGHAAEAGVEPPEEPILFSKATSAISGPSDPLELPHGATRTDWEVELGVVIGRTARRISEADALDHVAGYVLVNDVSERSFQAERGGQWIKGKSAPSFGKIGPWLVTTDEIENPQAVDLWLDLNGVRMQRARTSDMIFSVAEIIAYLSWFMTLRVGDVIATGTPAGVGMSRRPARFLKNGDHVACGSDLLGRQTYEVRPAPEDVRNP